MKHYPFGGSTAKRTINCPAWKGLSKDIPTTESAAALRGTAIHYLLEQRALDDTYQFDTRLGRKVEGHLMEPEDIVLAGEIWHAMENLMAEYQIDEFEAETTGEYDEDIGSTIDFIARGYSGDQPVLLMVDYKTGRGVQVDAIGNDQLLHNAMSLMANSEAEDLFEDVHHFVGVIIQPNRNGEVQVKTWEFTLKMVIEWEGKFLNAVEVAVNGNAIPKAGSHCAFCPAEPTCPAKTGQALAALQRTPDDLKILGENMAMVSELRAWCSQVEKAAFDALHVGSEVKGFKMVNKLARESWKDEELAIKTLRTKAGGKLHMVEEKLKSPAQIRKLLKARGHDVDLIEMKLTEKKSSGTTIVPESDKRDAVMSHEAFKASLASVGG